MHPLGKNHLGARSDQKSNACTEDGETRQSDTLDDGAFIARQTHGGGRVATGELACACFLAERERERERTGSTEPQSSNSIYSDELGGGARTRRRLESSS